MRRASEDLRKAAENGDEAGLKALLARPGCDAMSKGADGKTALILAAQDGHASCVELLLPASDALAKDEKGMTASDHARERGEASLAELIDAYVLAMSEAVALSSSTDPGKARKSAPLRV